MYSWLEEKKNCHTRHIPYIHVCVCVRMGWMDDRINFIWTAIQNVIIPNNKLCTRWMLFFVVCVKLSRKSWAKTTYNIWIRSKSIEIFLEFSFYETISANKNWSRQIQRSNIEWNGLGMVWCACVCVFAFCRVLSFIFITHVKLKPLTLTQISRQCSWACMGCSYSKMPSN